MSRFSSRRKVLACLGAVGASACAVRQHTMRPGRGRHPTILVRSSWQTENIGDIAHTPGLLALLRQYVPEANVILWPGAVDHGVDEMLHAGFPGLEIVHGTLDERDRPLDRGLIEAFARADLLIHGSGSGLPGYRQVRAWKQATNKPFGFFGISLWDLTSGMRDVIDGASFLFCRDSNSYANARAAKLRVEHVAFGPDAAFGMRLRDEARADKFLSEHDLHSGYLCLVPRLRTTPYEELRHTDYSDAMVQAHTEENERFVESDHAKLRAVIEAFVRQTGKKVLLCPEMTYQLRLLRPHLFDPLPHAIKEHVVLRRTYWFPDEAASTYARAAAVVSLEMHSPILALMAGTPAFYVRQPSDTVKGQMWRDIGLAEWMFEVDEVDEVDGPALAQAVVGVVKDPESSRAKVTQAKGFIVERHAEALAVVRRVLRG